MPPIRTRNKKPRGTSALPGLGFTPVIGLEVNERVIAAAEQRSTQSTGEATTRLPSETEESRRVDEGTVTHAIEEPEENCEFTPTHAALAVKVTDAVEKSSMSMNRGQKEVAFRDNQEWNSNYRTWLGYETRRVAFGSGFVLKDQHINELTSVGPRLCHNLTGFEFHFDDVSYDAKNSAQELTDKAVIHLAKSCPNLRFVQLQGTSGLQDIALEALFDNCADIAYVEVTTHSRHGKSRLDGSALEKLREHPHWGAKLKKLRLPNQDASYDGRDSLTRAVRALTKTRDKLLVQLVSVSECKKWGDWELEVWNTNFRKGRKQVIL